MALDLKFSIEMDASQASKEVDKTTKNIEELDAEAKKTAKSLNSMSGGIASSMKKSAKAAKKMKKRAKDSAVALAATAASALALLVAMQKIAKTVDTKEGLLKLGIDEAALKRISAALGNTMSQVEVMTAARAAINAGMDASQVENLAKSASVMAKEFDQSRQSMLELITSGNVSDSMLVKLGTSAQEIANKITQKEGERTGNLAESERLLIRQNAIMEAAREHSGNWAKSTGKAGDEISKALAELRNVATELGQALLPHAISFTKQLTTWTKSLTTFVGKWDGYMVKAHEWRLKIRKATGIGDILTAEKSLADKRNQIQKREYAKWLAGQKKAQAEWGKIQSKSRSIEDAARNKSLAASKAASAERKRQLLEDLRSLQEQAKDLIRNFSEKIVQTVADAGGAFGGIASALTDVFEKSRAFSTTGFGLKGMNAAVKVAAQFQGQMNVDLVKQIELQKDALGLRGKSLKAAKLMAGWIRGGADDTAEFLANEKAANAQLKAGLSTSAAAAKVGAVRLEQLNLFKDVTKFLGGAERARNALASERNVLASKGTKKTIAQAKLHDIIIKRLALTVERFKKIGVERKAILKTAMALAKLDAVKEKISEKAARKAELRAIKAGIQSAGKRVLASRGVNSPGADIAKAAADKETLAIRIKALKAQFEDAFQRHLVAGTGSDEERRQNARMVHLLALTAETKKLAEAKAEMHKAEQEALTLSGQLQQQFASSATSRTAELAAEMKSSYTSTVAGFGNAIASITEAMVKGDEDAGANIGKGALEALGNLATQWGLFFMAQGGAMLASGMIPNGAATMIGGGLLMALGGGLKGASSLLGPQPKASTSGSSAGQKFNDRIPGTTAEEPKNIRETYVMIGGTPWNKNSDAQEFSNFIGWAKAGGRKTGKRLAMREV